MTRQKPNICVICGDTKEHPLSPLCIKCAPYMYKKQSFPHQLVQRRKAWNENREKIIKERGNQCEWCGSEKEPFSIHHTQEIDSRTYEKIWRDLLKKAIQSFLASEPEREEWVKEFLNFKNKLGLKNSIKFYKEKARNEAVKSCPSCGRTNITGEKKSHPNYKCNKCGKEFNQPKFGPKKKTIKKLKALQNFESKGEKPDAHILQNLRYIKSQSFSAFIGMILPHIYEETFKEYKKQIEILIKNYSDMTEVLVVCKRCHYAHKKGYVICEKCKKNYKNPKFETCKQCSIKEIEVNDPIAKKIREIFNISMKDLWVRTTENECVVCGLWVYSDEQFDVCLTGEKEDEYIRLGSICPKCFEEYKVSNETRFIVMKH
ncbi:MAG: hypothetical protein E3J90_08955 [Promethearchaeota archaeon]|nr:MAG: hypothetical protein E3J90_08955 [Candidatus Lokiarchaeota archaeon]